MAKDYEHPVSIVAHAIYTASVGQARTSVDQIEFDANELPELFQRLTTESETAQVLIFASYLEDRVFLLIKSRMHHLHSRNQIDAVFGSNGPLHTFGNQLLLAHQLGWLSTTQKSKLDAFRKIRNEFAHRAFKASLSDNSVAENFRKIDYGVTEFLAPIRKSLDGGEDEDLLVPDDQLTKEQLYLCNLAILADRTFSELLVFPAAVAYQVTPIMSTAITTKLRKFSRTSNVH